MCAVQIPIISIIIIIIIIIEALCDWAVGLALLIPSFRTFFS